MASILDLSASSDSEDDVDYVPPTNGAASDSSCDEELSEEEALSGELDGKKTELTKKKRQESDVKDKTGSDSTVKVDEKKRANELWESFLNDVDVSPPIKTNSSLCRKDNNVSVISNGKSESKASKIDTKPICKVFEFAGETVNVVEKDGNTHTTCDSSSNQGNSQPVESDKRPACKKRGIDSVLGTILNKNKKLTVLDKTKLDWDSFKKDEGIDHELEKVNKGKQGFIERQRFLERSDLRSFEMEKSMRQTLRKK